MTSADRGTIRVPGLNDRREFNPDFLTELFHNPLDPGYADAAARRDGSRPRSRLMSGVAALTLVALGFLLAVAYQQTVADQPAASNARRTLVDQVQNRRAETSQLQQDADRLRAEVAALRAKQLGGAAVAELTQLEATAGLAPVRGSGAKITIKDGPTPVDPLTGEHNTQALVKDSDLQLACNALWSEGAEAIAVNGQRLTATSTIRQAGEAILVDFRPVTTPYEVVAIGPDSLADDFRDGYAGRFFKELASRYGMAFDAAPVKNVTLDAASDLTLRVARPSTPPSAPSGGSSPGSARSAVPKSTPSEGGR
ncbi:MAG TPA: DUF881 domain-containing protein [Actinoplanes sp.]|jgi:uncharacterized protein YlxW (UPF0749 family)